MGVQHIISVAVPLEKLLRESDIIILSCALNEHTRSLLQHSNDIFDSNFDGTDLINETTLALMKPNAIIINTAR